MSLVAKIESIGNLLIKVDIYDYVLNEYFTLFELINDGSQYRKLWMKLKGHEIELNRVNCELIGIVQL